MLNLSADKAKNMSDRKAELERKKAKLQALREEKERRRMEKEKKDVSTELLIAQDIIQANTMKIASFVKHHTHVG